MHLVKVECRTFRCLANVCFEPAPGLNIIRGENAQGKTSVLEAVLFAATSKSHRTGVENDLVQYGAEGFHVGLDAKGQGRTVAVAANWWRGAKRFKVNGIAQSRVSDILGRVKVVLFSPEDVELIKGGAAARRRFLDMELSQISPPYLASLQQYRQALRQRNELLRGAHPDTALLEVWEEQLASCGAELMEARGGYVEELSGHAARAHTAIAGTEPLQVEYKPDVPTSEALPEVLARSRETDIRRRATHRGPHRDEVEVRIDEKPARGFGSQGQQKTAALALKLAELDLVKSRTGEYPVLMLDEVLAELDAGRSRRLLESIDKEVQCLMTTTETEDASGLDGANFRIRKGCLEET